MNNAVRSLAYCLVFSALLAALPARAAVSDDYEKSATLRVSSAAKTLNDFPVLVRLSAERVPGFDATQCGTDGADLRFTSTDGTVLPHEIDFWNPSGESTVWVRLPQLSPGLRFNVYWQLRAGHSAPAARTDEMWTGYVGIWHCSEESGVLKDSSLNGYDATEDTKGGTASVGTAVGAKIGRSRRTYLGETSGFFDAGVNKLTDSSHAVPLANGTVFTASCWLYDDSATPVSTTAKPFEKGDWGKNGWLANMQGSLSQISIIGSAQYAAIIDFPTGKTIGNGWRHLTVVFNGVNGTLYVDGALVETKSYKNSPNDNPDYTLHLAAKLTGLYDELRLKNGAVTADWAAMDYRTQNDPDFVVNDDLSSKSAYNWFATFQVASDAKTLNDFPVLVRLSPERIKGFQASQCGENGADLRFTDITGAVLPHEIDFWNPSGESTVWVRLPQLAPNLQFKACWQLRGQHSAPAARTNEMWTGYVGVWHCSEESGVLKDSSLNRYDATEDTQGGTASVGTAVGAKIGRARRTYLGETSGFFDAGVNKLTDASHAVPLANDGTVFTASCWLYDDSATPVSKMAKPFVKGDWGKNGWLANMQDSLSKISIIGSAQKAAQIDFPSGKTIANGWRHLTVVFNGYNGTLYVDGAYVDAKSYGSAPNDNADYTLHLAAKLTGLYDELRLKNGAVTADWAAMDYRTQSDANFLSVVSVEHRNGLAIILR